MSNLKKSDIILAVVLFIGLIAFTTFLTNSLIIGFLVSMIIVLILTAMISCKFNYYTGLFIVSLYYFIANVSHLNIVSGLCLLYVVSTFFCLIYSLNNKKQYSSIFTIKEICMSVCIFFAIFYACFILDCNLNYCIFIASILTSIIYMEFNNILFKYYSIIVNICIAIDLCYQNINIWFKIIGVITIIYIGIIVKYSEFKYYIHMFIMLYFSYEYIGETNLFFTNGLYYLKKKDEIYSFKNKTYRKFNSELFRPIDLNAMNIQVKLLYRHKLAINNMENELIIQDIKKNSFIYEFYLKVKDM